MDRIKVFFSVIVVSLLCAGVFNGNFEIGTGKYGAEGDVNAVEEVAEEESFSHSSRANIVVDDDGGQDYVTIQAAIDNANAGDNIYVWAGTYNENVDVDKTVSLIGNGSADTFIDGGGSGDVMKISVDWVNVTGFNVTDCGSNAGDAGIDVSGNHTRVENCIAYQARQGILMYSENNSIANNTCTDNSDCGIYLYYSDNNSIANNTCNDNSDNGVHLYLSDGNLFYNNTLTNNDDGIYLYYGDNNSISNNTCSNNSDDGIQTEHSYENLFINNTCSDNSDYGIFLLSSDSNHIDNNICDNNGYQGIRMHYSDSNSVKNNTNCDNGLYGIYIKESDNNTAANNTCNDNDYHGISLPPATATMSTTTRVRTIHGMVLNSMMAVTATPSIKTL